MKLKVGTASTLKLCSDLCNKYQDIEKWDTVNNDNHEAFSLRLLPYNELHSSSYLLVCVWRWRWALYARCVLHESLPGYLMTLELFHGFSPLLFLKNEWEECIQSALILRIRVVMEYLELELKPEGTRLLIRRLQVWTQVPVISQSWLISTAPLSKTLNPCCFQGKSFWNMAYRISRTICQITNTQDWQFYRSWWMMKDWDCPDIQSLFYAPRSLCEFLMEKETWKHSSKYMRLYLVHGYWEVWSRSSHVYTQSVGWLKCWLEFRFKLWFRPRFILRLKVWFRWFELGFAVQFMHRNGAVAVLISVLSIKRCAAPLVPLKLVGTSNDAFEDQVDDLTDTEHYAKSWSSNHEVGEDSFLCGSSNVTVHNVGTWLDLTLHQAWQVETVINVMEDVQEGDLDASLDKKADQVRPPQSTVFLPRVVIELGLFAVLLAVLAFALVAVLHVHYHHQWWTGDEDELQGPQSDVGKGEEVVIADVCAARLLGVAVKVFLIIAPNSLSRYNINHHPEHKNHWEPDPAKCSGVFIHPTEQGLKSLPVHGSEQGQVTLGVLWSSLTLNISDEEYSNLKMEKTEEKKKSQWVNSFKKSCI